MVEQRFSKNTYMKKNLLVNTVNELNPVKNTLSVLKYKYERLSLQFNIYYKPINSHMDEKVIKTVDELAIKEVYNAFFDFWGLHEPETGDKISIRSYIYYLLINPKKVIVEYKDYEYETLISQVTNLLTQIYITQNTVNAKYDSLYTYPPELSRYHVYEALFNGDFMQVPINFRTQLQAAYLSSRFLKGFYKNMNKVLDCIELTRDLGNQEIIEEKELINPARKKCFMILNDDKTNKMLVPGSQ